MGKDDTGRCLWLWAILLCILGSTVTLLFAGSRVLSVERTGEEINFTILHTNDEHSELIPHSPAADFLLGEEDPTVGGFARLASAIDEIRTRKEREPVLLLSGGDFLGGTAFGWLSTRGQGAELRLMQEMGYDAVVIGNHEYDYGVPVLVEYLQAAGYPDAHHKTAVLATNTEAPASHPLTLHDLYRTTHLLTLDTGLTVGLFGLLGKDALLVAHDTGSLSFIDPHQAASRAVESLQNAGAEVIIALTHSGVAEDRDLARAVPGIHVIVGGHCHSPLEEPIIEEGTIIVQAGSLVKYLGCLEVGYNSQTGQVRVRNHENKQPFLIPIDDRFDPNRKIAALIDDYTVTLNQLVAERTESSYIHIMDTVLRSDFPLPYYPRFQESLVGNFVANAMRIVGGEKTGERVDVAVQSNGNIRGSILPGTMEHSKGNISFYDLTKVIAMGSGGDGWGGYPLVSFYLKGQELWTMLETTVLLSELFDNGFFLQLSGLRYSYNPANAVLFTLPVVDLPIPTTRAVTRVEMYTGEGAQSSNEGFVSLKRNDQDLYHVVTDSHNLSFLPLVAELFPPLKISPKNARGEPVAMEDFSRLIIMDGDKEVKVWQAVVEYAASKPPGEDGVPRIPQFYSSPAGDINRVETISYFGWFLGGIALLMGGAALWICHRRRSP